MRFLCSILFFIIISFSNSLSFANTKFLSFLKNYGAWDIIETELAKDSSLDARLDVANVKILKNDPNGAIQVLASLTGLNDNYQKGKKELLYARAYRIKGDFINSINHYSTAYKYLGKDILLKEPGIFDLYYNVFLQQIFKIMNLSYYVDEANLNFLKNNIQIAKIMWPNYPIWEKIEKIISSSKITINFEIPNKNLKKHLIFYLAALSIGNIQDMNNSISLLDEDRYKKILIELKNLFYPNSDNFDTGFFSHYPKAVAYFEIIKFYIKNNKQDWIILLNDTKMKNFMQKLLSLDHTKALDQIDKELRSTLLDIETKNILKKIRLAYLLLLEDYQKIKQGLSDIDFKDLPISLKLAILMNIGTIKIDKLDIDNDELKKINIFLSAFGFDPYKQCSNFFLNIKDINTEIKEYPLDYLLKYSYLRSKILSGNISINELKQGAYVYRQLPLGQRSILTLAKKYLQDQKYSLFNKYITQIEPKFFNKELLLMYYKIMGDYYNNINQIDNAINFYEKIFQIDPKYISSIDLLKIALFVQRNNKLDLAQNMFRYLWKNRRTLDRKLQAEVLFWIAETKQLKNDLKGAAKNYLEVYYYYKDQYIWSITALYRAGLIYEQKGMFSVAKKIFSDVLKNARRKTEKEAAKARLKKLSKYDMDQLNNIFWF